ncbi:MAG TPA: chromosome segregation protein SMC [Firmicutes bacterium]|nr:chromosome segregation protein SMC [Bacillota bacterium]
MRFTHLYLENWRNFSRVDVDLQRRVFLVGPNASGKSNLLDVFRFLHDIVSIGGGFQEAVRKRGTVSSLRCLAARGKPRILIEVTIGNDNQPDIWTYRIKFNQDRQRNQFIQEEKVEKNGNLILSRPEEADDEDPLRKSQTHLEQNLANKEFREIADFLQTVKYMHIVPQLVREPDRSFGRKNDPFGGDFLEQIARTPQKTQKARLRRICNALQAAVPQLVELGTEKDEKGATHLRGRFKNWRPKGVFQNEEILSDGTLRLLGLLWSALDGTGPLLLEEPELSLHPEVIRVIPQMFARLQRETGRQIFISTHSSDMLQDKGIGLDEPLLLIPEHEGTSVKTTSAIEDIKDLLEGGSNLPDIIIPYTTPKEIDQLLFSFNT